MSKVSNAEMCALAELDARISTDRLELMPILSEHAKDMLSVLSDASLYEYTRDVPPASLSELRSRYAHLESRRSPDQTEAWLNWVVFEIATGMTVGYVQATVNSRYADIAWVVGTRWQRQGFATEAAQAMVTWLQCVSVREVRAKIHPMHTASQRVAAKVGLSRTRAIVEGEEVWARHFCHAAENLC
jgi:RimJ/RimL family protein N-acetyltransferase